MNLFELIEKDKPPFADLMISSFTAEMESDINLFSYSRIWHSSTSICVADIVGTMHVNYAGKSWLWLLQNGIRMHINLPLLADNPNYYDEDKVKEPKMYFKRIGNDKLYIDADGNHRSCIAKFYQYFKDKNKNAMLHGVELNEYGISREHKYIYQELQELLTRNKLFWNVEVIRSCIRREDAPGFMQEFYDIKVIIRNYRHGVEEEITSELLSDLLKEESFILRKYLGKYRWFWKK